MYIDDILVKFNKVKKTSNGYKAQCPWHDDKNPSLDITEKNGKILMHCHAGCSTEDILRSVNLTTRDLFLENKSGNREKNKDKEKIGSCTKEV